MFNAAEDTSDEELEVVRPPPKNLLHEKNEEMATLIDLFGTNFEPSSDDEPLCPKNQALLLNSPVVPPTHEESSEDESDHTEPTILIKSPKRKLKKEKPQESIVIELHRKMIRKRELKKENELKWLMTDNSRRQDKIRFALSALRHQNSTSSGANKTVAHAVKKKLFAHHSVSIAEAETHSTEAVSKLGSVVLSGLIYDDLNSQDRISKITDFASDSPTSNKAPPSRSRRHKDLVVWNETPENVCLDQALFDTTLLYLSATGDESILNPIFSVSSLTIHEDVEAHELQSRALHYLYIKSLMGDINVKQIMTTTVRELQDQKYFSELFTKVQELFKCHSPDYQDQGCERQNGKCTFIKFPQAIPYRSHLLGQSMIPSGRVMVCLTSGRPHLCKGVEDSSPCSLSFALTSIGDWVCPISGQAFGNMLSQITEDAYGYKVRAINSKTEGQMWDSSDIDHRVGDKSYVRITPQSHQNKAREASLHAMSVASSVRNHLTPRGSRASPMTVPTSSVTTSSSSIAQTPQLGILRTLSSDHRFARLKFKGEDNETQVLFSASKHEEGAHTTSAVIAKTVALMCPSKELGEFVKPMTTQSPIPLEQVAKVSRSYSSIISESLENSHITSPPVSPTTDEAEKRAKRELTKSQKNAIIKRRQRSRLRITQKSGRLSDFDADGGDYELPKPLFDAHGDYMFKEMQTVDGKINLFPTQHSDPKSEVVALRNPQERLMRQISELSVYLLNNHCISPLKYKEICISEADSRLLLVGGKIASIGSEVGLANEVSQLSALEPHFSELVRIVYAKNFMSPDDYVEQCRDLTKELLEKMLEAHALLNSITPNVKKAKQIDRFNHDELPSLMSYLMFSLEGHEKMPQEIALMLSQFVLPVHAVSIIPKSSKTALKLSHNHQKIESKLAVIIPRFYKPNV